jgi:hypothetical protein
VQSVKYIAVAREERVSGCAPTAINVALNLYHTIKHDVCKLFQDSAVPLLAAGQTAATKDVLNRAFVELAKVRMLLLVAVCCCCVSTSAVIIVYTYQPELPMLSQNARAHVAR